MPIASLFPALTNVPGNLGSSSGAAGGTIDTRVSTGGLQVNSRASDGVSLLGIGALVIVAAMMFKSLK